MPFGCVRNAFSSVGTQLCMQGGGYLCMSSVPVSRLCEPGQRAKVTRPVADSIQDMSHMDLSLATDTSSDLYSTYSLQQHRCETAPSTPKFNLYSYHIVYLPSYGVPVLLFNACSEGMAHLLFGLPYSTCKLLFQLCPYW